MTNGDKLYEKQLNIAYWYVTHKLLLKNILTVFLLVLSILLISYYLYSVIFNLVIYEDSYQAALTKMISPNLDYQNLRKNYLPQKIVINQIESYPNTVGFDIVAEIVNPNTKWWASFDYQFQIADYSTDKRKGFILPGERKKIVDLAVEDGNLATRVIFSNIIWNKEINYAELFREKFRFDIKNINYLPARELGINQTLPVNRVIFEVENQSAYNYREVNFLILLNRDGETVAVNQANSGALLSGQTKVSQVNFLQLLGSINNVEIIPEVNILDETVFLKY